MACPSPYSQEAANYWFEDTESSRLLAEALKDIGDDF
ncbi:hypothetical protein PF003_g40841 [Phytophthora fragariae]|nr:hypothetical protein PF003_g40928 [Phytophthora fragariae]KAE8875035.1 hypothetical protein PF003_g40841 [Phytophthora fragariae]